MVGAAKSSARSAQPLMAVGGPSHLIAGSSNPYGERPCATIQAKIAVAYRHTSAMTPSLARGTEANYVAHERPCCRLADVLTRTQPEAIAPQSDTPARRSGAGRWLKQGSCCIAVQRGGAYVGRLLSGSRLPRGSSRPNQTGSLIWHGLLKSEANLGQAVPADMPRRIREEQMAPPGVRGIPVIDLPRCSALRRLLHCFSALRPPGCPNPHLTSSRVCSPPPYEAAQVFEVGESRCRCPGFCRASSPISSVISSMVSCADL